MGKAVTLAEKAKEMEDRCRKEFKHISRKSIVFHTVDVGLTTIAICRNTDCSICDGKKGKIFAELLEIDKKHN